MTFTLPRLTSRRAAAVNANQKLLKIWLDKDGVDEAPSARNQFENTDTVPFRKRDMNVTKEAKDVKKMQKHAKKTHDESKAQELEETKAATNLTTTKKRAVDDNGNVEEPATDAATAPVEGYEPAQLLEAAEIRQREHEAHLQRRAARMVHSNKKMVLSWRTRCNMRNKRHPNSPDHSPIKATDLRLALKYSKIVKFRRSTRRAVTANKFKNAGRG